MITLEIQHGDGQPSRRAYPDEQITIGRRKENLIVLEDNQVSGRHALIEKTATGWVVVDRRSTNGTFVDGEKIAPDAPIPLRSGARIGVGPYTISGDFGEAEIGATLISAAAQDGPQPDTVAEELEAMFARLLHAPERERAAELRSILLAHKSAAGDAAMAEVLDELVQRFGGAGGSVPKAAEVGAEFYPAGFRVLAGMSHGLLGRDDQFAVVEEVDRFGELLAAFVATTCAWVVRCVKVRDDLKETFGTDVTRFLGGKRGPVEAGGTPTDVARGLLDWTDHNQAPAATSEQLEALFKGFVSLQGALLEGARAVAEEVLRHLSPEQIETQAQQTPGLFASMKLGAAKNSPLWQAYCKAWSALAEGGRVQNEVVVPIIRQAFARMHARGGDEG